MKNIKTATEPVKIAIVGKYFNTGDFVLSDSYISVIEAVKHAAYAYEKKPEITWLNAEDFEQNAGALQKLSLFDGVIVPGGFGNRGVEGKIAAIKYLRENKIPFLGLCYGMQLAVVEFSRNVAGLKDASTTEVNPATTHPVVAILPEQRKNITNKNYGGTMRLGAYPAILKIPSIAFSAYGQASISERHRHRYEINPEYLPVLEQSGLVISGLSPDKKLAEIIELSTDIHPFFLATQFHPEFKSRPLDPHPLFKKFIQAGAKRPLKN